MPLENPRRRKLTQLVADHILGDKYRYVTLSVVDTKGQPDHVRRDRRTAPLLPGRRVRR